MTEPKYVDPITYAWQLCNPKHPLPERLKFEARGKSLPPRPE